MFYCGGELLNMYQVQSREHLDKHPAKRKLAIHCPLFFLLKAVHSCSERQGQLYICKLQGLEGRSTTHFAQGTHLRWTAWFLTTIDSDCSPRNWSSPWSITNCLPGIHCPLAIIRGWSRYKLTCISTSLPLLPLLWYNGTHIPLNSIIIK